MFKSFTPTIKVEDPQSYSDSVSESYSDSKSESYSDSDTESELDLEEDTESDSCDDTEVEAKMFPKKYTINDIGTDGFYYLPNGILRPKRVPGHHKKYQCSDCGSCDVKTCSSRPHEPCSRCKKYLYEQIDNTLNNLGFFTCGQEHCMFGWIVSGIPGIGQNVNLTERGKINLCHTNAWLCQKEGAYIPGSNEIDVHAGPGPIFLYIKQMIIHGCKTNPKFKSLVKPGWRKRMNIIFESFSHIKSYNYEPNSRICRKYPVSERLKDYIVNPEEDVKNWDFKVEKKIAGVNAIIRLYWKKKNMKILIMNYLC